PGVDPSVQRPVPISPTPSLNLPARTSSPTIVPRASTAAPTYPAMPWQNAPYAATAKTVAAPANVNTPAAFPANPLSGPPTTLPEETPTYSAPSRQPRVTAPEGTATYSAPQTAPLDETPFYAPPNNTTTASRPPSYLYDGKTFDEWRSLWKN